MANRRPQLVALPLAVVALLATANPASSSSDSSHVFKTAGIVIRYPSGWHVSTEPLTGITDPVQRLVVSSYRIPASVPSSGGYYTPRANGVLAQLDEEVPPIVDHSRWPSRPRHFTLPGLSRMEGFAGKRWAELLFQQHDRRFYIFIGIGRNATPTQIHTLLTTLDQLTIHRRA